VWNNKDVLVTGGAGMVGNALCRLLVEQGARVTILDDFSRGKWEFIEDIAPDIHVFEGDAADWNNTKLYENKDVVFNLAAKVTGMHYNREHHADMFYENVRLQVEPLKMAIEGKAKMFHCCSTVCVYAPEYAYPSQEETGHSKEPEPTNAGYGWAKRMGERYALWAHEEYGLPIIMTRYTNLYGIGDEFRHDRSHVIPALIRKCLEQDRMHVFGTGKQIREFMFAEDAARVTMKLAESGPLPYPINVASGEVVSIRELLEIIQGTLGTEKEAFFDTSYPDGYPARMCDVSRMKAIVSDFEPTPLPEGIAKLVEWYTS
jgi:nucleoside-diphosphate-sugar epimerase